MFRVTVHDDPRCLTFQVEGRLAGAVGVYQRDAFNLMTSPAARRAFDLQAEPARLREDYGRNSLGQSPGQL